MKREGHRGHHKLNEGRQRKHRGEAISSKTEGAKTFRRKRAIMFLEQLESKQVLLKKQLETTEPQSANPVIAGELKATQSIIEEFVQLFELYEFEEYRNLKKDNENNDEA